MANGRKARTRAGGGAGGSSKKARLQHEQGGHVVPGFVGQDGEPPHWEARTGYTKDNRIGASPHGRTITLPGKGA